MYWYQFFNKNSWNFRMYKRMNLKFPTSDIGMYKRRYRNYFKDWILKFSKNDMGMRWYSIIVITSSIKISVDIYNSLYGNESARILAIENEKKMVEGDRIAREGMYFNKFGVPTKPGRGYDNIKLFLDILGSADTYDELFVFMQNNLLEQYQLDQIKGLDSWITIQEANMHRYYAYANGEISTKPVERDFPNNFHRGQE